MPQNRQAWFVRVSAIMALLFCLLFALRLYDSQVFQSVSPPGRNQFMLDGPPPGPPVIAYIVSIFLLTSALYALWRPYGLPLCISWITVLAVALIASWPNFISIAADMKWSYWTMLRAMALDLAPVLIPLILALLGLRKTEFIWLGRRKAG
jgi:hypothetical protein